MTPTVAETICGEYQKFEIRQDSGGVFGSPKFYVWDGKPYKGYYTSLAAAVQAAEDEG